MDVQLTNGSVHYEICGEGHPVMILHALALDHRSMKAWMEPVFEQHKGYKRIYVDIPAHGHSKIADGVKTSDELLVILLEFIDAVLSGQRFSLVGMSFGGYLAQGIMDKKHSQIDGFCLLVPALHLRNRTLPSKVVMERDESLFAELGEDEAKTFDLFMVYQNRKHWELFQDEVQPGRLLANRAFLGSEWRSNGYFFSFEPLASQEFYPQPALIVLGRQDAICGYQDHLRLLDKFPHAALTILDQTGHFIQIEQRCLVQNLLDEWLERVEKLIVVRKDIVPLRSI